MIRIAPAENHGLSLDVIQIDGGTQSRATLNQHVVDDYAEAIKAGAAFPPIVVFYDGKKHWLADGFHRFHAYQKAGKTKVAADIRQGTRRDAILHSVGANETHGLRRTRDDKRRAVLTLLNDKEWSKWSDREIARRCAVGADLVGRLRPADTVAERQYVHPKTGSVTTMKTAGINASRAKPVVAENAPTQGTTPEPSISKASEPETAPEGTAPEGEDLDAIRAGHITRYHVLQLRGAWTKANPEARSIFLAETNLDFKAAPGVAAEATGNDLREPVAAEQGQIIREGDAPRETDRASGDASCPDTSSSDNPSAANPVEAVADPQVPRPSATAKEFPDPHSQRLTTGGLHTSSDDAGAKGGVPRTVGQGGGEPGIHSQSEQQPAVDPQDGNEAVSGETASVAPFNNPRCQKPDSCKWAHSQSSCSACNSAWFKARAA